MAFKMKGHELPGPNQRKASPTKFIGLVISGISAIASAAKKNKEKNAMAKQQARDAMQSGASGLNVGSKGKESEVTKTAKKADIKVNETKKAPVAEPTVDVSKDDSKSDAAGAMKMIKKNK
tara:strand:- start:112 stop:474 length:363 start_codon:yes stop_codon:yes gene_type:complete